VEISAKENIELLISTLRLHLDVVGSDVARAGAARALGEIKDARAVEPLTQALEDVDEEVREAAKEALEKIKAKES